MRLFNLFCFLALSNVAFGINTYKIGDTLYVWSKSGLVLRDTGSLTSNKLQIIPYGSFIICNDQKTYRTDDEFMIAILGQHFTIDDYNNRKIKNPSINIKGRWIRIKYLDQNGYLFDDYLSKFPPPRNFDSNSYDFFSNYLDTTFKLLNKLDYSGDNIREIVQEYGGGISYNSIGSGGSVLAYYYFPKLSFDEVLILLLYSGFLDKNSEYRKTTVSKCTDPCSRKVIFNFCCALQTISITEVGRMTILEFVSAC